MTRQTNNWIKIHSPEIDLSKYKLAYDGEGFKGQQEEGWLFQCIMLHQSCKTVNILHLLKTRLTL